MSRVKKSMKQKMAAFLAVCMTAGSLPTGMVTAAETRERPEDANLAEIIEFDPVKLKDAMEKAVESDKMVTPPTVVASSSEISGFYGAVYELKDAETLLAADAAMPAQTDVRIFLSPQSEGFGEDGKYELTGTEGMVFMIENQGNEDQGYQLLFGNKITDVIEVESKERLLEAYYNPEDLDTATEAEAEKVPETTAPAADNAAESGTGETAGETEGSGEVPETQAPETDPVATESETQTVAEVSILDRLLGTLVAYGAEPTATDSEDEAFDKTDDGDQPTEPENGSNLPAGETPAESQESTEGETAVTDPATAETVEETEAAEEDKTPEAEEEEEGPRFTAVDDRGYVRLTYGQVSASVLVVKSSFDKIDVEEGMSEPMGVEVTTTRRMAKMANAANGISLMNADDETEAVDDNKLAAVAFYETNAADLLARAGGEGESPFTVNLYDYSGTGKELNPQGINNYLNRHGEEIRFNTQLQNEEPYNAYKYNGKVVNVYQGILNPNAKDSLLGVLFPAEEVNVSTNVIDEHLNVNVDEFFEYDANTGTWFYDSDEDWAHYEQSSNSLTHGTHTGEQTGFWPFEAKDTSKWDGTNWNGNNCYFGMSVAFDFYRPEEGIYNNDEMVFSFSGDDDVWVYLTNTDTNETKLVLDLGGIHGAMDGSINFATGEVLYSNENALGSERYTETNSGWGPTKYTANPVVYGKVDEPSYKTYGSGKSTYSTYTDASLKNFLTSGSNYKLEFFYLERGAGASNCMLDFNLPVIPKNGILLAKQLNGSEVTDEVRNAYYNFRIVTAESSQGLIDYRTDSENSDKTVEVSEIYSILGNGSLSISDVIESGSYFYVEEIKPGTDSVEWEIGSTPVKNTDTGSRIDEDGYTCYYSAIYKMPEEGTSGFAVICNNWFGKLQPQVGKQAILKDSETGIYDITLSVTGDDGVITSTTTENQVVDMVVVIDRSGSMDDEDSYYYDEEEGDWLTYGAGAQKAIWNLAQSLSEKSNGQSRMRIVGFGGSTEAQKVTTNNVPYYGDEGDNKYYDLLSDWISLTSENVGRGGTLWESLYTINFNRTTDSASGFLGAKAALANGSNDEHQKVVVYITDGEPNTFVKEIQNEGSTTNVYFAQPSDRQLKRYNLDKTSKEYGVEAAQKTLSMLKSSYPDVPVYTISYGEYVSGSGDDSWLKPYGNGEGQSLNGSNGITKYFAAEDANDLAEVFDEIQSSIETKIQVQNPVVVDELSKNAEIYNAVSVAGVSGPRLSLGNQALSYRNNNGTLEYFLAADPNTVVATFAQPTGGNNGTITWYVADTLGEEDTRTLTFPVKAVGDYYENAEGYPNAPDAGTGTHADQTPSNGYYSNGKAELEFGPDGERETMFFPKPVIRPVQQYTELLLKKTVSGDIEGLDEWSFDFYIGINKPIKDEDTLEDEYIPEELTGFSYVYKVSITDETDEHAISLAVPIGANYRILEEVDSDNLTEHYKVVDTSYEITVDGSNTTEGKGKGTDTNINIVPKTGAEVEFTNEIGRYTQITIHKEVKDSTNTVPEDTEFTFKVEMKEDLADWAVYDGYGNIEISDGNSAEVWIDPDDADNQFRITETDDRRAWETEYKIGANGKSENGSSVELNSASEDQDIYFTNYYYDHSISLKKEIAGEELKANADYRFVVNFETANTILSLNQIKELSAITKADSTEVDMTNRIQENSDKTNSFIITLKKDETIQITNLPKEVNGYTITEQSVDTGSEPYKVVLDKITAPNGITTNVGALTASNTFNAAADQSDSITYTNKYEYVYGYLKIDKIVDKAVDEDTTFTFKVTNQDVTSEEFYVSVKLGNNKEGSATVKVPIGTYTVEEVDSTVRYEFVMINENPVEVTSDNTEANPALVTVTNENTGHNYFSDVDTIVNTVVGEQFVPNPKPKSLDGYSSLAASTQTALEMNAGAYLLPNNKIRMQPNNGDEMIQPA